MRGLDPRIYHPFATCFLAIKMHCQVKPGNDGE
jgi:hypothetical protein